MNVTRLVPGDLVGLVVGNFVFSTPEDYKRTLGPDDDKPLVVVDERISRPALVIGSVNVDVSNEFAFILLPNGIMGWYYVLEHRYQKLSDT